MPDFVFRHTDGTIVYFEIVGYWTPEYLEAKRKTLALFVDYPILISVSKHLALNPENHKIPSHFLTHSSSINVTAVLKGLEYFRVTV